MNRRTAAMAMICLAAAFALVTPAVAGNTYKNKYPSGTVVRDCQNGDTVTYSGPLKMWPPNHKLQDVSATATDGDGTSMVSLTIEVDVLDAVGGDGGAKHDPDVGYTTAGPTASGNGTATVPFQLRAERSGKGEGRTYDIKGMATFDNGAKHCDVDFQVFVPHDMSGGADWKS